MIKITVARNGISNLVPSGDW